MSAALIRWWRLRAPRERALLMLGAALVVLVAGGAALAPMLTTIAEANRAQAERAGELAHIKMQTAAVRAAPAAAPARSDPRSAVERALRERGLLSHGATLDAQDERINVMLPAAAMQDLVAALAALGERDAIRILAATLTPRVDGGVRAELTLGR